MVPSLPLARRKTTTAQWVVLAVVSVVSLGVVPVLFGLMMGIGWLLDGQLVLLDAEGVTTRRGRKFRWADLTSVEPTTEYRRQGSRLLPTRSYIRLSWPAKRLHFDYDLLDNGAEALAYLEQRLGRSFGPPPWRPHGT